MLLEWLEKVIRSCGGRELGGTKDRRRRPYRQAEPAVFPGGDADPGVEVGASELGRSEDPRESQTSLQRHAATGDQHGSRRPRSQRLGESHGRERHYHAQGTSLSTPARGAAAPGERTNDFTGLGSGNYPAAALAARRILVVDATIVTRRKPGHTGFASWAQTFVRRQWCRCARASRNVTGRPRSFWISACRGHRRTRSRPPGTQTACRTKCHIGRADWLGPGTRSAPLSGSKALDQCRPAQPNH